MTLGARLRAQLRAWLRPDLCDRCGLVWTAIRHDTRPAGQVPCPCCGFTPGR